MRNLFRLFWDFYSKNRGLKSHPHIFNTIVNDVSEIAPSVSISNSTIYGKVRAGKHCILNSCDIIANKLVEIGDYSILTGPVRIVSDLNHIEIGKFCSFAPHVTIWEPLHNHKRITSYYMLSQFFGEDFRKDITSKGPVRVGHDVWIGTMTVVLSGVTIGDGAVIGAGSVVCKDIPSYTIACGIPAVPLKARFPEPVVRRLQEIRWWDWSEEKIKRNRFLFERELTVELLNTFQD